MSTTVYTYNDKVLKNVATDKWLKKPDAPAGFVMNASNAQYNSPFLYWNSPSFPNSYDGGGKQCVIVNNSQTEGPQTGLMYLSDNTATGGPMAIKSSDLVTGTVTMVANTAGAAGYGKYLGMPFSSEEAARAWIANVTITILDP